MIKSLSEKWLNADIITPTLTRLFNMFIWTGSFPDCPDCTYSKKGSNTNPGNYRPVSILPILSKFFEMIMDRVKGLAEVEKHRDNFRTQRQLRRPGLEIVVFH